MLQDSLQKDGTRKVLVVDCDRRPTPLQGLAGLAPRPLSWASVWMSSMERLWGDFLDVTITMLLVPTTIRGRPGSAATPWTS